MIDHAECERFLTRYGLVNISQGTMERKLGTRDLVPYVSHPKFERFIRPVSMSRRGTDRIDR